MKTYPARFVGEFDRESAWNPCCVPNVGDVAVVHGYPDGFDRAYIRCACGAVDPIPIEGPKGWSLTSREPVNIEPSVMVTFNNFVDAQSRCHYFVHGGELQMLDDTTAVLK